MPVPPEVPAWAPAAAGLAVGVAGTLAALRARAALRLERFALRLVRERERAFVEAARRLADAAAISPEAVRAEIDRAVRELASDVDAVLFFEEREGRLTCVAASGKRVEHYTGMQLRRDDPAALPARALACGHRLTSADAPDARPLHPADREALAIPLALEAGRACVVYAGGRSTTLAENADRIVALIDQATPAYRIAMDRADDRARAEFDGLTGLLTPRAFRARLADAVERARFAPLGRLAVLFVDTDRFKAWNDTYGHASGDALLRAVAECMRASTRRGDDLAARNGGDEFCAVFADTEKSVAIERAEALRRAIAAIDCDALTPDGAPARVRVTASVGVAAYPYDAQTADALLERADEAMYRSKHDGRDRVSFCDVDGTLRGLAAGSV